MFYCSCGEWLVEQHGSIMEFIILATQGRHFQVALHLEIILFPARSQNNLCASYLISLSPKIRDVQGKQIDPKEKAVAIAGIKQIYTEENETLIFSTAFTLISLVCPSSATDTSSFIMQEVIGPILGTDEDGAQTDHYLLTY